MSVLARRLLVVEDEPLTASLLAEVLASHGFAVETAADVLQARAAVRAFDPDVALIEIVTDAVSNAARHGHPRNVEIKIDGEADLHVTVTDDGDGAHDSAAAGLGTKVLNKCATAWQRERLRDGLTITFVGQADTLDFTNFIFSSMDASAAAQFCEAGSTTNCVSFAGGSAAGTSKTLALSGASKALDITATPYCRVDLWSSAPAANVAWDSTGALEGWNATVYPPTPVTGTSTSTWSNGQTLYVTSTYSWC